MPETEIEVRDLIEYLKLEIERAPLFVPKSLPSSKTWGVLLPEPLVEEDEKFLRAILKALSLEWEEVSRLVGESHGEAPKFSSEVSRCLAFGSVNRKAVSCQCLSTFSLKEIRENPIKKREFWSQLQEFSRRA